MLEVAWDVSQRIASAHSLLSTKAASMVERWGDEYVCVGPWQLADPRRRPAFTAEPGFSAFTESCRALGVPARVGRWEVPGRPRTILVDASALYRSRDEILARLWDEHRVDS